MNVRIKLLTAAAAIVLPAALAAQGPSHHAPLQDRPAASRTRTPPPAPTPPPAAETPPASQTATPPVADTATPPPADQTADEATQQARGTDAAVHEAHATAERVADAVEADAVADSQVQAQTQAMPPPMPAAAGQTPAPVPATAQAQAAAPVGPAAQADFRAGANVVDQAGGAVGTIESADASGAVVATGTVRAKLPLASFGRSTQGLVIAMTKVQLEAAVAAQSPAPAPGS
jgi:hypothetical protein